MWAFSTIFSMSSIENLLIATHILPIINEFSLLCIMPTILIAEDEQSISELIAFNLQRAGFEVLASYNGPDTITMAQAQHPDLVLLDQMMPGLDGHGVLREMRRDARTQDIPIIFLTAKAQTEDKIQGLELGADDYVTKPFSPKELILRINNVLRRCEQAPGKVIHEMGPFKFDKNALKFYINNQEIDLTSTEFKLLVYLAERCEQTIHRDDLLTYVWGYSQQAQSRTLDTHMKRLRQKLGDYANCIETIRAVGYQFTPPQSS